MTTPATQTQFDAATVYEQLFVPAEFQEWPPRVIDAARIRAGHRVLDVACGTGVLARAVAQRVGPSGTVTGVDPDAGMLAVAQQTLPGIDYRQGVAESLPFEDESFDAVVSQFGLMFFKDRMAALREMQRVLRPGGRMVVAVWDTLEHTPAYATLVKILDRFAGQRAGDALRRPFGLGDKDELAAIFSNAGARDIAIATHIGTGHFPDVRTMVTAELQGWMPMAGVLLDAAQTERILAQAEKCLAPFRTPDGQVRFAAPAHIVTVSKIGS